MAKRSSRSEFQKNRGKRHEPSSALEKAAPSIGPRRKLAWQMHHGDLVISFTPALLNQELAHRRSHQTATRFPLAFAFHRIPAAESIAVDSIQSFARKICERWPGIADVQVFGTRWLKEGVQENRCQLIESALRAVTSETSPKHSLKLQVFLPRNDMAFVGPSLASSALPESLGLQSRWLGGMVFVAETKEPPSRAYLKLTEALLLMGWKIESNHRVLDLAAAPGGWSWVALQANAHVVAVDRSELTPELMRHPRLQFLKGDVFQFQSRDHFDWVVCDVICDPAKSLELLQRVLQEMAPDRIIWTLKFRGEIRIEDLNLADRVLKGRSYLIRHLNSNKNEVTIIVDHRKGK